MQIIRKYAFYILAFIDTQNTPFADINFIFIKPEALFYENIVLNLYNN